jgi:signal transduction histidine kinase
MMGHGQALLDLTRAALVPDHPGTVGDLARVVAQVTGLAGVVLWEAPDERCGDPTLSVLAVGFGHRAERGRDPAAADPVTRQAQASRSLALPSDVAAAAAEVFGHPVTAALPIEYADGCSGVLTLLDDHELLPETFDAVVDLVEILPVLCSAVRERQTLDLANACNSILHDADVESPDQPLSRERLGEHMSDVCERVARILDCPEVSIFLRDPADPDDNYRWLAGAGPVGSGPLTEEPSELLRSGVGGDDRPLMEVRLINGEHVNGLLRCAGSSGPPHHFTASDFALVRPVAAQLSRYWRGWLRRRALGVENETWRGLAAGMTALNEVLAEKLRDAPTDAELAQDVTEMAVQILRDVVPGFTGAHVSLTNGDAGRAATERPAGLDRLGWRLKTPIRVGTRHYGVLEGVGLGAEPANSPEVAKIIADQIGLHRHLRDTLTELHRAKQALEASVHAEAEAMEDLKHQLVSPLRAAAQRTDTVLISRRYDPRVEGQLKAIRGLCRRASRVAMSAGVFSMLNKGEQPASKLEVFGAEDLQKMLIAAAADAEILGDPGRKITFDVNRSAPDVLSRRLVRADGSFLQQCVGNVLDNAAKYSYDNTRVTIEVVARGGGAGVAITSTGIPLNRADLAKCRERNWRGDNASYTTGEGAGLGLWIVDNLMRAMKGRLEIVAIADRTTIRLVLPIN